MLAQRKDLAGQGQPQRKGSSPAPTRTRPHQAPPRGCYEPGAEAEVRATNEQREVLGACPKGPSPMEAGFGSGRRPMSP